MKISLTCTDPTDNPFQILAGKVKSNISQPFYAQNSIQTPGEEKLAVIDAQKANEFRLDDDETVSSVRKLLREASKHKKAKKKGKKKKDKKEKEKRAVIVNLKNKNTKNITTIANGHF